MYSKTLTYKKPDGISILVGTARCNAAWPVKDESDRIADLAPSKQELDRMGEFVKTANWEHYFPGKTLRILLSDSQTPRDLGQKIALFHDGTISDVWCAKK